MRSSAIAGLLAIGCSSHASAPQAASAPVIDRFGPRAAHLLSRARRPELPKPDQPIDLDKPPFLTLGLGPDGQPVRYYNFDVQSDTPATLYRLTRTGGRIAIDGQPDIVDVLPGDSGYSDFWRIVWVEVGADVAPGSIASAAQVAALPSTPSQTLIDCPIVPRGSTAKGGEGVSPPRVRELAYRGHRVSCLDFGTLLAGDDGHVPTSPIYVTFAAAGPESGFRTEATPQTHNVVMTLPGDPDYSPLWAVHIYNRDAFDRVHDAASAQAAPQTATGPLVNCPVIAIGSAR